MEGIFGYYMFYCIYLFIYLFIYLYTLYIYIYNLYNDIPFLCTYKPFFVINKYIYQGEKPFSTIKHQYIIQFPSIIHTPKTGPTWIDKC